MLRVCKRPHVVPSRMYQLAWFGLLTATWRYFDVTRISGTTFFLEMSQTASSSETCRPDSTTTWNHQVGFAGISSNFARSHLDGQKHFNASCLLRSCRQCALEIGSMEVPGVKMNNGRLGPFAETLHDASMWNQLSSWLQHRSAAYPAWLSGR